MKNIIIAVLLGIAVILFCPQVGAQSKSVESKIDSLLSIMTLEEKIGQMNQYNGFFPTYIKKYLCIRTTYRSKINSI